MNINLLFSIANLIAIISFMVYGIFLLRLVTCVADIAFMFIAAYAGFEHPGMISTFVWAGLALIINLTHIARLLYLRMSTKIPSTLRPLYDHYFSTLRTREFMTLMAASSPKKAKNGEILIQQDKPTQPLVVTKGTCQVVFNEQVIRTISDIMILGEMSYLAKIDATTSVICAENVNYYEWNKTKLRALKRKHPHVYERFDLVLRKDMVEKIATFYNYNPGATLEEALYF